MKWIYLCLLIFLGFNVSAQKTENQLYVEDFNVLVTSLKELSPVLYKNISKEKFEQEVNRISEELLTVPSKNVAIYLIQELLFKIGDGHIGNTSVFGTPTIKKALPFNVILLEDKLYIKDFPRYETFRGEEIIEINGISSAKLVDSLKIFIPNDGGRDLIPYHFQMMFNSLYGNFIAQNDSVKIKLNSGVHTFPSIDFCDSIYKCFIQNPAEKYFGKDRFIKNYHSADYSYFRFLSFERRVHKQFLKKEFKNFMKEVNKSNVENLVIDLRYNPGGDPAIAGYMVEFMAEKNFHLYQQAYISPKGIPTYLKYMKDKPSYFFRRFGTHKEDSLRQVCRFDLGLNKTYKPRKNHFTGNIYVITGSMTHSSANMMCFYLSKQSNVVFVGDETTGAINYLCASTHCKLKLPHLQTTFSFGLELLELVEGSSKTEKEKPLIPENKMDYQIEDILNGRDLEMEWIQSQITNSKI